MNSATLSINLTAIAKNWSHLQRLSNSSVITAAVVKANAYGLGIKPIAQHLFETGVRTFFVSTVDEAVDLRLILNHPVDIYYLNGYSTGDSSAIDDFRIMPVLNSLEQIKNFKNQTKGKKAAIQIDLGMNRLGIDEADIVKVKAESETFEINLLLGHLSSADDENAVQNKHQYDLFCKLAKSFQSTPKSLAATGGILLGKDYHFDITRPGIGIFGGNPLKEAANVIMIDLPVLQVKHIGKNVGIGYNHTFTTSSPRKIATVASGYADGLSRQLSNTGALYAGNIRCPILGRVSMDLITVDVTSLVTVPNSLSVVNSDHTIDELADQSSTIGYEILTSLGSRYKRVYHY